MPRTYLAGRGAPHRHQLQAAGLAPERRTSALLRRRDLGGDRGHDRDDQGGPAEEALRVRTRPTARRSAARAGKASSPGLRAPTRSSTSTPAARPMESTGLGSFILSRLIGVTWNACLELGPVRPSVNLGYQKDEYQGFDRTDDIKTLGVKVGYKFRRWLTLGAEYTYTKRDSNQQHVRVRQEPLPADRDRIDVSVGTSPRRCHRRVHGGSTDFASMTRIARFLFLLRRRPFARPASRTDPGAFDLQARLGRPDLDPRAGRGRPEAREDPPVRRRHALLPGPGRDPREGHDRRRPRGAHHQGPQGPLPARSRRSP